MNARVMVVTMLTAVALAPGPAAPAGFVSWWGPGVRSGVGTGSEPAAALVRYAAPVALDVVRPFRAPPTRYGPGHRGVDLAATPGQLIRSAGDGVVRFAGAVAGRSVVVIVHADGISTEYEPVRPLVAAGAAVRRGTAIARLQGHHPGCPRACLHWGARRGPDYLDPLLLLRPLGPVVLLPWRGH